MKKIFVIGLCTVLLSGCSPADLFELMAKSDIEQAASQSVETSTSLIQVYDQLVTAKQAEFDHSVKLVSVVEDASYGYAFKNKYQPGNFTHEVIAILPPLEGDDAFYEGWLVNPATNKFISTGRMTLNEADGTRTLIFTSATDYTAFSKVVITAESDTNPAPDIHILEGSF
jgi:hypothetical protein